MNTTQTLTKKGKSPLSKNGKSVVPKNGNRNAVHHRDDSDDASLLLDAMLAFRHGDFTARVPSNWTGVYGKIADVFNETIYMAQRLDAETARVHPRCRQGRQAQATNVRCRSHWQLGHQGGVHQHADP